MEMIKLMIQMLAVIIGSLAAFLSIPLFFPFRWPAPAIWGLKIFVSALSPVFVFMGLLTTVAGLMTDSLFIRLMGLTVVLIYGLHFICVTRPPNAATSFEQAFGPDWQKRIPPERKEYFLPSRTKVWLPAVPNPRLEQNVPFATIPGTDRLLLCDVWQPPENVSPSGMAFIYFFGSAWYILDKDVGTRPLFRHLAAQGHVIMDVAYRLAPETDLLGMVQDVKRAIVWMKEHAGTYRVNPSQIIVGGGSAGGHLALMAAYTDNNPQFTPEELAGKDVSVSAVISLYGQSDLRAMYYHTNQHLTTRSIPGNPQKVVPTKIPHWMVKAIGKDSHRLGFDKDFVKIGAIATLLGGHPDECPEKYELFSPVSHVHQGCPPTLLLHGEHDIMAPVTATRRLYSRLVEKMVPTVMHIIPQTDHGFDLALPQIAPAAHNAFYDIERFLALIAVEKEIVKSKITASNLNRMTYPNE